MATVEQAIRAVIAEGLADWVNEAILDAMMNEKGIAWIRANALPTGHGLRFVRAPPLTGDDKSAETERTDG